MANSLLSPTIITKEALSVFKNSTPFLQACNKEYSNQFAKTGAKIGTTLSIRDVNRYTVRTGAVVNVQDQSEATIPLTVDSQAGVDMSFNESELTLTIDEFSDRYIKPAVSKMASYVDRTIFNTAMLNTYNLVGTAGTDPNTALVYLQAGQKLDEFSAPLDDMRYVCINPAAQANTVDALKGLFQSGKSLEKQYISGRMGNALGFDFAMSQNVPRLTTGSRDNTTPLTNAATAQTGSSLICDGFDASVTIKQGDVFTIAGVNAVNPDSLVSTGSLQQFVVTADATATGGGAVTLSISPSIVASGAKQNVSNGAADDKAITFVGSASTAYAQNMAFHKDAFTFVSVDLSTEGYAWSARENMDGVSMRLAKFRDGINDKLITRLDILYGFKAIRPEWATRIIGA